jgi:hypothetical protein
MPFTTPHLAAVPSTLRRYYSDLADRAVRTAAQSALLVLGADQVNVIDVNWLDVAGFAGGGAVLSVLTTLVVGGITGRANTNKEG